MTIVGVLEDLILDEESDAVRISNMLDRIEDTRALQVKWEPIVESLKKLEAKLRSETITTSEDLEEARISGREMSEEEISKGKLLTVRIMISDLVREIEGKELQ